MTSIPWKSGKKISIDSGVGFHYLIEMLEPPFIAVFNIFKKENEWSDTDATSENILFVKAVTRQFISHSITTTVKLPPSKNVKIPDLWIASHHGSRMVTLFSQTEHEMKFLRIEGRPGGKLIKRSKLAKEPEEIVIPEIALNDHKTIDSHELSNIEIYPNLNERIILCQKMKKNVDPDKDIKFDRDIPIEYLDYIKKCYIPLEQ